MLLTLLIITQVTAEWVEISQQHYRKPLRTHSIYNPFTNPDKFEVEETTKSWSYSNRSVLEYSWNKSPGPSRKQSSTGDVKRVQSHSGVKTSEEVRIDEGKYPDLDQYEFERASNRPAKPPEISDSKQKGSIERVSNIGNVKRVQLNNSPVKSPVIHKQGDRDNIAKTRYEEQPLVNEKEEVSEDKKSSMTKTNNRRIYINKIKSNNRVEVTSTFPMDEDESSFTEEVYVMKQKPKDHTKMSDEFLYRNSTKVNNILPPKPTFVTETEEFQKYEPLDDRLQKVTQHKNLGVSKRKHIFTTEATDIDKNEFVTEIEEIPNHVIKQANEKINNLEKHHPVNKENDLNKNSNMNNINDHRKSNKENNVDHGIKDHDKINPDKNNVKITKGNKPDNKVNNMENLMKFMKVVADTISQNTRRSFGGKMRYLHELKDSLLTNIADRIDSTWPDDEVSSSHRSSRSAHESPRGHHVHFPSSESALMSISFLTFAVFLIKLILQVIQTYKNKAMMLAPVMVAAAGRTATAQRGHH